MNWLRETGFETGADLICLATGSNVPVLFGEWLEPGQHVTSIVASNKGVFLRAR